MLTLTNQSSCCICVGNLSDVLIVEEWSGRLDLNQRPHAPQACALPGCATSRPIDANERITPISAGSRRRTALLGDRGTSGGTGTGLTVWPALVEAEIRCPWHPPPRFP